MKEKLVKKMLAFCEEEELLNKGDSVVVGVSGGLDSICLLRLLYEIREVFGLSLYVLHVHHGIRGEEADRDAALSERVAKQLGLPFRLVKRDVKSLAGQLGMTEEEAGRKARYEAFEAYRCEVGADKIAVAHHEDDLAETVLFHLFRGTGPRGLAGIPAKRDAIIRPLLTISRDELEALAKEQKFEFVVDGTNLVPEYTRNKIRLQLLPFIREEINGQAVSHIAYAAEKNRQWSRYIESQGRLAAGRVLKEQDGDILLHLSEFKKEDDVIQDEILRQVFHKCIPGAKDVSRIHYEQTKALADGRTGSSICFPQNVTAVREYQGIRFSHTETDGKGRIFPKARISPVVCDVPSKHILNRNGENVRISLRLFDRSELPVEIPQKDYTKWLDYDMIKGGLVLRNPEEGDYFVLNGNGDRKKLSRYYIDQKIPREQRAGQLVLAAGKHVLWAVPGRISDAVKVSAETKRVLVVTKEREEL